MGEGAEIDLFGALKEEFRDDRFTRVPKGVAGADIHHVVMYNGKECGKIVYDSKNRKDWKWDYVTKLRKDQIEANAEHSILSTLKFPAGAQQVTIHQDVIIANPARVVTLAWLLRRHMIRTFSLRIAGKDGGGKKKAALYALVTSGPFSQKLKSIELIADKMLGLDANERKAHEKVWKDRGRLINSLLDSHADVCADIEDIIETEDAD